MAELLRYAYAALEVIPIAHRFELHSMYEDSDLGGASHAECIVDFLEKEVPGSFVAILANDSVYPPCAMIEQHFECDYYEPYWYTILVSASLWEQYKAAVVAKDQQWKDTHGCKRVRRIS